MCEKCESIFNSGDNLKSHTARVQSQNFKCNMCENLFPDGGGDILHGKDKHEQKSKLEKNRLQSISLDFYKK